MRINTTAAMTTSVCILFAGCTAASLAERDVQLQNSLEKARVRALEAVENLSDGSKDMIKTNLPFLEVVHVPFGSDYTWAWTISSNRTVRVRAYGSPGNLLDVPARISEAPPKQK